MATPTATAAPVDPPPVTAPSPTPPPGWKSSEAWFTLLVIIVGALPSSGLLANAPLAAKIVGLASSVLAALGYTTNRTSLKRAHLLAATMATSQPANDNGGGNKRTVLTQLGAALALGALCFGTLSSSACGGAAQSVKQGGDAFLQCEKVSLSQLVPGTNPPSSLLAVVSGDLVAGNYAEAIAALIGQLGTDAVGCAVLAVETVVTAGKTSGAAALTPIEVRALEMIKRYGWKLAPPAAQSTAKP